MAMRPRNSQAAILPPNNEQLTSRNGALTCVALSPGMRRFSGRGRHARVGGHTRERHGATQFVRRVGGWLLLT